MQNYSDYSGCNLPESLPTSEWSDKDIEAFYSQFESTVNYIPKKDITIVQGDFNAKIRSDAHKD